MTDNSNGRLSQAMEHARKTKNLTLIRCLKSLKRVEKNWPGTETKIYSDFAPLSLYFERLRGGKFTGNGAIIFHGRHDGGGNGGAPTFSVSLNNDLSDHWEIHT